MRIISSALVALALAACDRPQTLLICHNSNCAEPADPENDDTLAALNESLTLSVEGKPAIDGIEVDLFWRASDDTCIFAHDLETARMDLATQAADAIAFHITTAPQLTFGGGNFQMFVELKDFVDAAKTVHHSPEQRMMHAACAWDFYTRVEQAADARGVTIDFFFGSFGPEMLKEVIRQTPPNLDSAHTPRYEAYYGVPKPLDAETRPLGDYAGIPITLVEFHSQWITDDAHEAVLAQGIEVAFFMFSATVEHFAAIEQYEPAMVNTSEAILMRRWLER
ncbi:MAG TPA: hypothetical protein VMZ53_30490 [Kofleriaceae bacterium]|nr:hypothetical protein [Kofleriaceae bacterium]